MAARALANGSKSARRGRACLGRKRAGHDFGQNKGGPYVTLGNPQFAHARIRAEAVRRAAAVEYAMKIEPVIRSIQAAGTSLCSDLRGNWQRGNRNEAWRHPRTGCRSAEVA
jgi:hypothetical protein